MPEAYICSAVRTPIGRYGGALAAMRTDDLAAAPIAELRRRLPGLSWDSLDDLYYGCANQAGEDNRNVARMAALLAGLPTSVPGVTLNRLCGSGMDAVAQAARALRLGEADLTLAGGVESMSRAPLVMPKAEQAFSRRAEIHDTTIGWRFINPRLAERHGTDSMPETAERLAEEFDISRADQDAYALASQARTARAFKAGEFDDELMAVDVPRRRGEQVRVDRDEHPRADVTLSDLARLRPIVKPDGTVTAGNASGVNDGACALLLASEAGVRREGLEPLARVLGSAVAGVAPSIMGFGPAPAMRKLLARHDLDLGQIDLIELNEAFAAQVLAVTRDLGLADDDPRINPMGGAIALGHPLGMSGARLVTTASHQLRRMGGRFALCAMCIGVGQGIALLLERP